MESKFELNKESAVLVVVDIQQRLAAAMNKKDMVVRNTQHLIEAAKLMDVPVVLTEQYSKGLGPTIDEIKEVLPEYSPIEKITFSCCGEDGFMDAIEAAARKVAIVVGMETHVCVLQTCLDLLNAGYYVHMVRDAVCSRTRDNFIAGMEYARQAGVVITSTEIALFQLLNRAGTEEFKAISRRIK